MSKENTEKLIQVINEKRSEIEKLGLEQYRERYEYNGLSGWYVGVQAHIDGSIYTVGPTSQNSVTGSSWKGEAVTVIRFSTENYEFEGQLEDYEIEDLIPFREWIALEHWIDKDEYEDEEKYGEAINEYMTMYEYSQFNREQYDKWVAEDLEFDINEYGSQSVEEKIDEALENLQNDLDYNY